MIYERLLRFGRLSLGSLTRQAALPIAMVKSGLAVLIQQGLVLHFTAEKGDGTSYEANWLAAYSLLRSGKTLELATERLGLNAGIIMDELLAHGHLRIKDLRKAFLRRIGTQEATLVEERPTGTNGSGSSLLQPMNGPGEDYQNGKTPNLEYSDDLLDSTLQSLYLEGYIDRIGITDFSPSADLNDEAEAEVAQMDYPKISKSAAQEKIEVQKLVESRVRTWKIQKAETLGLQPRGIKRDREEDEQVTISKKLKTKMNPTAHQSTAWQSGYDSESALTDSGRIFKVR